MEQKQEIIEMLEQITNESIIWMIHGTVKAGLIEQNLKEK